MILFETIRWKNFLSTGNQFTEIKLDKNQTTLIIGNNGAGKSTILDALCFSLFGKPFRKINKPQLINSTNEKDCIVEIEFKIGNTNWKICRGIKPALFEIYRNDTKLDQSSSANDQQKWLEQTILKMNYKSFTQIVILGSSNFVPFMQLSSANRREVIEDLLDIKIFTSMNNLIKDKIRRSKEDIRVVDMEETWNLGAYEITLKDVRRYIGPNYQANIGDVELRKNGRFIATVQPEKRFYPIAKMQTTEAGIDYRFFRDVYIVLGEPHEGGGWTVRSYIKPLASWIWGGAMLMAMGGLLSLSDRRLRIAAAARKTTLHPQARPAE